MNDIVLKPSYWATVSGGKDSLFMLKLILNNLDIYPLDGVIHYELEIDFPFIKNVIDYMQVECEKRGIKFLRIKPRLSWFDLYNKWGMPSRRSRWCNSKYKMDSVRQLKEFLKTNNLYLVSYIGYCYNELERAQNCIDKDKNCRFPLIDCKIDESDILEWAKNQPIFNDYYKYNKRCGCMYCPMSSRIEMAYLLKYYPENYNKFIKMCRESEKNYKTKNMKEISVFSSNIKYNTDYVDNNVRTIWLPKLEKMHNKFCEK